MKDEVCNEKYVFIAYNCTLTFDTKETNYNIRKNRYTLETYLFSDIKCR